MGRMGWEKMRSGFKPKALYACVSFSNNKKNFLKIVLLDIKKCTYLCRIILKTCKIFIYSMNVCILTLVSFSLVTDLTLSFFCKEMNLHKLQVKKGNKNIKKVISRITV